MNTRIRQRLLFACITAFYTLCVLGPVLALILSTLDWLLSDGLKQAILPLPSTRLFQLFISSLTFSAGVALISSLLGWLVAVWLWSHPRMPARKIIWIAFCLAAIPPALQVFNWFQVSNAFQSLLGSRVLLGPLRGWPGCLGIEVFAYTPFALGCTYLGLNAINPEMIEAGRAMNTDLRVLYRIALPLCAPGWLAGAGMIYLLSLLDYSVPSLFQVHVYAMEVFAEFSASARPERTLLVALPLCLVSILLVIGLVGPLKTMVLRTSYYQPVWKTPPDWPAGITWLCIAAMLLPGLHYLGLLLGLAVTAGGLRSSLQTFQDGSPELLYSLAVSALAVLFSTLPAWAMATQLAASRASSLTAWGLMLFPLGIPATLVGIGMIYLRQSLSLLPGWFEQLAPPIVSMARFTPIMALALSAQMRRADPLLAEAASIYQPSCWRRLLRVHVPAILPGILVGAGLVFALSLGELAATLMVVPPGRSTLSLRIYSYLHYGASESVAGLCLLVIMVVFSVLLLVSLASRLSSRPLGGSIPR